MKKSGSSKNRRGTKSQDAKSMTPCQLSLFFEDEASSDTPKARELHLFSFAAELMSIIDAAEVDSDEEVP